MGKVFKKVGKGLQKLVGMDIDANKRAAEQQAAATREASDRVAADSMAQAQAAQQQIEATAAQNAARAQANDLLNRPMESAEVDLTDGAGDTGDDLLGRKRGGTRQRYRTPQGANSGLVVS